MILFRDLRIPSFTFLHIRVPAILAAAIAVAVVAVSCSSTRPAPIYGWNWTGPAPEGFYLVKSGDSLSLVAERSGVSTRTLAKWNRLRPPYTIYADTLLRIAPPDGRQPRPVVAKADSPRRESRPAKRETAVEHAERTSVARVSKESAAASGGAPGSRRSASSVAWEWPLSGPLLQGYRAGDRTRQGIRIGGRPGEQVRAAADGVVVYSGSGLKGYGNLIIVKHNDKYLSAYGFNRRLFAAEGDSVRSGQAIAEIGQGADGSYLLHFELRRNGAAVDPILYLPARR